MSEARTRCLGVLGSRTHIAECGAGPPVVLVPGLGLSTRFYAPLLEAFGRAGLRLIVPDLPGTGRTRGRPFGWSVAASARFLLALTDALELERPAWVAHSVGCQVALDIAAAHGERVAALVLASPTGAPGRGRLLRQVLALPRAGLNEPWDVILAVVRDYLRVLPCNYIGTWLRAAGDHPAERLARVHCPTLLLAGTADPLVRPELLDLVLARIAGARLERIPGGGHALPRDALQPFAAAATSFLLEVAPTPAPGAAG